MTRPIQVHCRTSGRLRDPQAMDRRSAMDDMGGADEPVHPDLARHPREPVGSSKINSVNAITAAGHTARDRAANSRFLW
jgi:hypothetical protein